LVQLVEKAGCRTYTIVKNNEFDFSKAQNFNKILISPGPGLPSETDNLFKLIDLFYKIKPILGICLGHQAIAEYFGAKLINLPIPFHGVKSKINIEINDRIFENIPQSIEGGRYHSWVVSDFKLSTDIEVIARSQDGLIMGLRHKTFNLKGLQFHLESIMTDYGKKIIENWLSEK